MFRKILASFLSLVFTLLFLPVFFLWGVYNTFFNVDFYKGNFVDKTYEIIVEDGAEILNLQEIPQLPNLSGEDFTNLFKKVFTREDLANFFNYAVDNFVQSLKDVKNQVVMLKISLTIISEKREVLSNELANLSYERLPRCDSEVSSDNGEGFECIPAALTKPDFVRQFKAYLDRAFFAHLPDQLSLDLGVPEGVEGDVLGFLKQTFSWLFVAAFLFLLLDLFLLGMVIMEPWYKVLRWEAKTVLIPSLIMLLFLILFYFSPEIFESLYAIITENTDLQSLSLLRAVLNLFLVTFAGRLFLYVIPIFLISLGLWIVALVYEKKTLKIKL